MLLKLKGLQRKGAFQLNREQLQRLNSQNVSAERGKDKFETRVKSKQPERKKKKYI